MRVWIEIRKQVENWINFYVTLHVRVWIEIVISVSIDEFCFVTLHVRVWIEIAFDGTIYFKASCHPPREGVD